MVEQLDLCKNVSQDRRFRGSGFLGGLGHTDVPAVIGIVISNTMILAVNTVASGTTDVG